jgi:adenylate kinase family enzyme
MARRIVVIGVSGNGKTTFARRLAAQLDVPYTQIDALNHLPGWVEASDEDLRVAVVRAMDASEGWVLDGSYERKIGNVTYDRADTIVWLDQPLPLVLWRLVRRALKDIITRRDLFNGNRQTLRYAFFIRDSLVSYAIKQHFRRRCDWPEKFARMPNLELVRLRSPRDVEEWLRAQRPDGS